MHLLLDFDGRRLQGARPFAVFESKDGAWQWNADAAFPFRDGHGDVLGEIRRALHWAGSTSKARGAAIGFFSYEFARQLEPRAFSENSPPDELQIPDVRLVFCEELHNHPCAKELSRHSEGALATEESPDVKEILRSLKLPQNDLTV